MSDPCFPARGNRARLIWMRDDPGTITDAGPQQSMLKHDSDKRERCYLNKELEPAPPPIKRIATKSE